MRPARITLSRHRRRRRPRVVVIRASGWLVVARTRAYTRARERVDRGVRVCIYVLCVCVSVSGRSVGLRTNPLDIPRPSGRYGCLFNMCNRQRAQIQSIKSINDSIVRSHATTRVPHPELWQAICSSLRLLAEDTADFPSSA